MSQPIFETKNYEVLTTVKEIESAETLSAASQEKNIVQEIKKPEGNDSDLESIVNEQTSVPETENKQNIYTDRESEIVSQEENNINKSC